MASVLAGLIPTLASGAIKFGTNVLSGKGIGESLEKATEDIPIVGSLVKGGRQLFNYANRNVVGTPGWNYDNLRSRPQPQEEESDSEDSDSYYDVDVSPMNPLSSQDDGRFKGLDPLENGRLYKAYGWRYKHSALYPLINKGTFNRFLGAVRSGKVNENTDEKTLDKVDYGLGVGTMLDSYDKQGITLTPKNKIGRTVDKTATTAVGSQVRKNNAASGLRSEDDRPRLTFGRFV